MTPETKTKTERHKMKLTGQAAIEANEANSQTILIADFKDKTFANISRANARAVLERGGSVYAFAPNEPNTDESEIPEMKEGISIKDGRGNDLVR